MRPALRLAGAVVVATAAAACGQFGGVHRPSPSPSSGFAATAQQRQLVGYIVQTTVIPGKKAAPKRLRAPVTGTAVRIDMLTLYERAAATCPGLPWTVLAAIGTVESNNGLSNAPGVHSGANVKGAEGPMQFLPATFAEYALPVPPGGVRPPTPYDPVDAVYAAARYLCANGGSHAQDLARAVFAYNHANWYVNEVLQLAARYAGGSSA